MTTSLWVRTLPRIDDVGEMKTILLFSLRSLWGDLEPYSCDIVVRKAPQDHPLNAEHSKSGVLIVECPSTSSKQVRAALTLVSPPPYLEDTLFQFDVIDIQESSSIDSRS